MLSTLATIASKLLARLFQEGPGMIEEGDCTVAPASNTVANNKKTAGMRIETMVPAIGGGAAPAGGPRPVRTGRARHRLRAPPGERRRARRRAHGHRVRAPACALRQRRTCQSRLKIRPKGGAKDVSLRRGPPSRISVIGRGYAIGSGHHGGVHQGPSGHDRRCRKHWRIWGPGGQARLLLVVAGAMPRSVGL